MAPDHLVLLNWSLSFNTWSFSFEASFVLIGTVIVIGYLLWRFNHPKIRRFRLVKLDISLGKIGKAELQPNLEDIQIAHQIWTELVTRKAAIPIDPDHDVIVEVYDSWYALFTKIRDLIGNIPADLIKEEQSTKELIHIATATLNDGLRPHLTRWQARFRSWYDANAEKLKEVSPQELQRQFPKYSELISDMLKINQQMISYSKELKRLIDN